MNKKLQQISNHEYNFQLLRDELCNTARFKFHKDMIKRHYDDYLGHEKPFQKYFIVEILGMFTFFIIGVFITLLVASMRFLIFPFNTVVILKWITGITLIVGIVFTLIILSLAVFNIIRIVRSPNIFGIIFGLKDSKYLLSNLQSNFVKYDNQELPVYYTLNLNKSDENSFYFDSIDFLTDDKYDDDFIKQFNNNEEFIIFMHYVLINLRQKRFKNKYGKLSAYDILSKSYKKGE